MNDFGYDDASLVWEWTEADHRPQSTRFEAQFEMIGDPFVELLNAAKRTSQYNAGSTIRSTIRALRACASAIHVYTGEKSSVSAWARALLKSLESDEGKSEHTRWNIFNQAHGFLKEAARARREEFHVRNPFSRRRLKAPAIPLAEDRQSILAHARLDVIRYLGSLKQPPQAHRPFIEEARRLASDSSGVIGLCNDGPSRDLQQRWNRGTGLEFGRLTAYLYPSASELVPFFILITDALAANPDSVAMLRRDSMQELMHPAYGRCYKLKLEKPRAGDIAPYLLRGAATLSVATLIRDVIQLTEPLVSLAAEAQKKYAFLAMAQYSRAPRLMLGPLRTNAVRAYHERHGVPYSPLKTIRVARGLEEYRKSKDPFRVKRLLRQGDLSVTMQYLDESYTGEMDAEQIADVQLAILGPTSDVKIAKSQAIEALGSFSLPSHACADPSDQSRPRDDSGLCAGLLFPFNDRNFIFDFSPRSVAFLLREVYALREAQKMLPVERFNKKYARRLAIIESDVLPSVPKEILDRASPILELLPPLPYMD